MPIISKPNANEKVATTQKKRKNIKNRKIEEFLLFLSISSKKLTFSNEFDGSTIGTPRT